MSSEAIKQVDWQTLDRAATGQPVRLEELRQRAERLGYEEGVRRGLLEGRRQGQEELAAAWAKLQAAEAELEKARQELATLREQTYQEAFAAGRREALARAAYEAAELASVFIERLLARALQGEEDPLRLAEGELARLGVQGDLTLSVHPDDLPALEAGLERLQGIVRGQVTLRADAAVGRFGFVAEGENGRLDSRLRTRWQQLLAEFGGEPA